MRGHVTRKPGSKKWYFVLDMYDESGKRHRKWFSGFNTRKEAEKALAAKIHEIETGSYVMPTKETVETYMTRWLEDKQPQVRYHTHRKYAWLVNNHIIPRIGHIELAKLKPAQLQTFYTRLLEGEDALSPRSVVHIHRLLHEALDRAVKWGLMSRNVVDAVDPPKADRYQANVWTPEQAMHFLDEVRRRESRYWPAFVLAVMTGMRQSELLGLKWTDVDWEHAQVSVQRTLNYIDRQPVFRDLKTDRSRRNVALSDLAIEALRYQRALQAEDRLFYGSSWEGTDTILSTASGAPLSQNTLNTVWQRLLPTIDVPKIRFHDLRHTHASLLLQQGVHPKIVSERLGHATVQITLDTYSHVLPGMQKSAANQLDQVLRSTRNSARKSAPGTGSVENR
ncbi:MAG: site-specific integrase [Alicyclobacillus sp.]|nr:site-specific integrase [Alicyclobacillus sp.]